MVKAHESVWGFLVLFCFVALFSGGKVSCQNIIEVFGAKVKRKRKKSNPSFWAGQIANVDLQCPVL